jgi:hypothetical protein
MKKLLLSSLLFVFAASAFAQSGGPDAYGYIWRDNNHAQGPVYNWIDITTRTGAEQVTGLIDDNSVGPFSIGFTFPYYWYTVNQFKIGANGYIAFSGGIDIASPFPAIPLPASPNNYVSAMSSDLNFDDVGNPGQCWYWTNNTDTLIVSWINVPFWQSGTPAYTGSNTFQIILSAVDTSVTYQYETQQGASAAVTAFCSIGIENSTGQVGLQHSYDMYPPEAYAVKFYYPQGSTFSVSDASASYCNNPETGALFLSKNGAPFTMTAQVSNTGNVSLSSFNTDMRVLNSSNIVQVSQTVASSALATGASEIISSTNTFNPTTAGTYRFRATTNLSGDLNPGNNYKTLEMHVVDTTTAFQQLSYCGNTLAGTGISWQGGNAGVGIEIVPPYYPCYIRSLEYFISANTTASNDYILVYDNQGVGGGAGNLLDSSYYASGDIQINSWNVVPMTFPIQIDSGSVFIAWMMDGDGITLGTDTVSPISNRSYEILGAWSTFRYRETTEPMIRMNISASPTAGIENLPTSDFIGDFYPSPSDGRIKLDLGLVNATSHSTFDFYDIQGKLVASKSLGHLSAMTRQSLSFDLSNLDAGIYVCKITTGDHEYNKKLVISR